jgi:hypothetical protein
MEDTAHLQDRKTGGKWLKKAASGGIGPQKGRRRQKISDFWPFLWVSGLKLRLGIADANAGCMTTMTKTAAPEVTVGLFALISAMAARITAAIEAQIPIGYEDETGFHTGVKPRDAEAATVQ